MARRWRHSPWTGIDVARAHDVVAVRQLAGGGVTADVHQRVALVHHVRAERASPLMTRPTAFSLPGMSDDARITVSPSLIRIGGRRLAIRDSAAIGSPCEPVRDEHDWSSGSSSIVHAPRPGPAGTEVAEVARDAHVAHHRAPDERHLAVVRVRGVEHLLDAVHVRGEGGHDDPLLGRRLNTASMVGSMSRSVGTNPGTSALVESARKRSTPSSPSRAKARRSVMRPSSGSWSILKSPVCSTSCRRGSGSRRASASGIEWLTATNSQLERAEPARSDPR